MTRIPSILPCRLLTTLELAESARKGRLAPHIQKHQFDTLRRWGKKVIEACDCICVQYIPHHLMS